MKKSKKGTPIGVKDANYHDIKVGDHLVLPDTGLDVTINGYGKPVSPSGAFVKLTEEQLRRSYIKGEKPAPVPDFSAVDLPGDLEEIATKERPGDFREPLTLEGFTDQDLADELRSRGYEVTATKTITVKI